MIIKLGRSVGNNLDNTDDDVRQIKKAFSRLRMFDFSAEPEPHGYMTRPFRDSILKFQKENNLTIDGKMFPGGETEKFLNKRLTSEKGSPVPKVQKGEILPPPKPKNIPGTNIPDRSQPEQGFPPPRQLKMEKWRLDMDKGLEKIPPRQDMDSGIWLPYDKNDPIPDGWLRRKRDWEI